MNSSFGVKAAAVTSPTNKNHVYESLQRQLVESLPGPNPNGRSYFRSPSRVVDGEINNVYEEIFTDADGYEEPVTSHHVTVG